MRNLVHLRPGGLLMVLVALMALQALATAQQQPGPIMDIQGMWNHNGLIVEDRAIIINGTGGGARIGDYTGMPLNDAGRQQTDSWMAARLETLEHQCHPHPTQYSFWGPGDFRITNTYEPLTDRIIGFRFEGTFGRADRTIWLDGRQHPSELARHTWAGFSTGVWDGNQLTITTTHLKEGWVQRNGIHMSDEGMVREHVIKHGEYLSLIAVVNDPEHFEEPLVRSTQAKLDPTIQLAPDECGPFHTNVMNANQPRGYVPHWLPGQNPQLREFSDTFGVPLEATRGGAKTMYPEYQDELKKLIDEMNRTKTASN